MIKKERCKYSETPTDFENMQKVGSFFILKSENAQTKSLLQELVPFYTQEVINNYLVQRLIRKENVSFRAINYIVTKFASRINVCIINQHGNVTSLHADYKRKLDQLHRRNFDCFKRRQRIYFQAFENWYSTTVGQLHFMRWAYEIKLFDINENIFRVVLKEMSLFRKQKLLHNNTKKNVALNVNKKNIAANVNVCNGLDTTNTSITSTTTTTDNEHQSNCENKNLPLDNSDVIDKPKKFNNDNRVKELNCMTRDLLSNHSTPPCIIFNVSAQLPIRVNV